MALISWGAAYINPADIIAVIPVGGSTPATPYRVVVTLRNGKEYTMDHPSVRDRSLAISQLVAAANRATENPVTYQEVNQLLTQTKNALRRDIKALRQTIEKEAKE